MQTQVVTLFGILLVVGAFAQPASADMNYHSDLNVCRNARFWERHAGTENDAPNLVELYRSDNDSCLTICGEIVDNTALDSAGSALEGLCTKPKSGLQTRLSRQLLAGALSCRSNGYGGDCLEGFDFCNIACTDGEDTSLDRLCLGYFKCNHRGGYYNFDLGACVRGTCSLSGEYCGTRLEPCPDGESCIPFENNCALEPFDRYPVDPPAGSRAACRAARATPCTIVGPGEAACAAGNRSSEVEVCLQESCADRCYQAETSGGCGCDEDACGWSRHCLDLLTVCPDICPWLPR